MQKTSNEAEQGKASELGRYRSLVSEGQKAPPDVEDFGPGEAENGDLVFDREAYSALEMESVFGVLDSTKLEIGRCALQRALAAPHSDPAAVRARQQALEELQASKFLRDRLETLVEQCQKDESSLLDLAWADFQGIFYTDDPASGRPKKGFGYEAFKQSRALFKRLFAYGESPPAVKSPFLRSLLNDFGRLGDSRFYKLLSAGLVTEGGPVTREETPWYMAAYRFRPTIFKPLLLVFLAALLWSTTQLFAAIYNFDFGAVAPYLGAIAFYGSIPLIPVYIAVVGTVERDSFIAPVGREFVKDALARRAIDALGEVDLLLTLLRYRDRFPTITCLPDVVDADHHRAMLRGVRNPVITLEHPNYVENDVDLEKARLSFITGPNSGGKTALCKTVLQCQALAQMGSYVPASEAVISTADRIYYQVPQPGHLDRAEGRFATELSRTRDIFFSATPNSLLVLDEPFEGTSFKERLTVSKQVLDGFIKLGSSVLFITHNHELAKTYRKSRSAKVQFRVTDFDSEQPTYRFKQGIASHSHAEAVAKEIGFSKDDIDRRFETQD